MPVTLARATKHTETWDKKLGAYGYWARHLFFAAHVTTAAKIIQDGALLSRSAMGAVEHDVANMAALEVNPLAWNYARLYFRPRTPFHLRTEGIKLLKDCYRQEFHMSVPIMFLFNLGKVLSMPGTAFCNRKMAHAGVQPGEDLAYFDEIDFAKVYHEAPIGDPELRRDIHDKRMAEVLVPDRLSLAENLDFILCRTRFDFYTLENLIAGSPFAEKMRVVSKPTKTYYCDGAYIDESSLIDGKLSIKAKPSKDYRSGEKLKFRAAVTTTGDRSQVYEGEHTLTGAPLVISGYQKHTVGTWRIDIEDCLAFAGEPPSADKLVVR